MKVFKMLLLFALVCSLGYFSWTYMASKSLEENLERATLVMKQNYDNFKLLYEGMDRICKQAEDISS